MKRFILFSILYFSFLNLSNASIPPLEREITLQLSNEKITVVLKKIEEQAAVYFSYSPSIISEAEPVSVSIKQKTIREALALILPKNITYKERSNYIILKEKPLEKTPPKTTEVSGYVYEKNTDKKLPNVTLYDKKTLQSVTTNEFGFYSISIPNEEECLSVNKEDYQDTCVSINDIKENALVNISIDPIIDSTANKSNRIIKIDDFGAQVNELFKKFRGYINTQNVKDEFTRNSQVALLPFVGTNKLMSGNVYNNYSFNIIGGYSKGTKGLELGSVFNIDKENVNGIQAAGVFNIVGDSLKGVGLAGVMNVIGENTNGLQAAGVMNVNVGTASGERLAGVMNLNWGNVTGFQIAGVMNASRHSVKGLQGAGVLNVTGDTLIGSSIAGIINVANKSMRAVEISGLLNIAHEGKNNVQLSGLANSTNKGSSRVQVAALFNKTPLLTGSQIGFINYTDSARGVPIGVLSFVKKGLHQIEFSSDEVFYANIAFRTGVPVFYNIVTAGIQPKSSALWHIGYGMGTSFKLSNKIRGEITATAHHVSKGAFYFATSELYKFYAGVEFKLGKKISIAAGPTYNLYWSDVLLPDYQNTYNNVAPYHSFNKALPDDYNLKGWLGGKVVLRFF